MEYIAHEETRNGVTLKIIADEDRESPRDWDNLATLCCDHGRYNLGDDGAHRAAADAIQASRHYRPSWEDSEGLDFSHGPDLYKAIQRCDDILTLPLYLYDHSGITMSTAPFSCQWDSGQVGFAFITRERALSEYGGKVLTAATRAKALSLIVGEVETYDMYLTGDVWGYVLEDEAGEQTDSMWGCYGLDYAREEGERAAGWRD